MKKSTLIIASLVIMTVGLVAAIPITLRYKLNHFMFVRIDPLRDFPVEAKHFEKVNIIKVFGMRCELISADAFLLEVEKRVTPHTTIEQRGDTLFVSTTQPGGHIRIFSKDLSVIAVDSEVTVRGSYDPYNFASYLIDLHNSKLRTQPIGSDPRMRQHIGDLSITGMNNSSVAMAGSVRMGKLYFYDISSISVERTVSASDLKVEYARPVMIKSHSYDGVMTVESQ